MRIHPLDDRLTRRLLAARARRDPHADRVARRILADVRRRGDRALLDWTRRLDRLPLAPADLWLPPAEFRRARRAVGRDFLRAVERAARNLRRVAERQKPRPWWLSVEPGVQVGQLVRPLDSIGCYVPGGRFSLVSTLLMAAVPAQVAGVPEVIVACPRPNDPVLAAADWLGLRRVVRLGGAQAIAALAYGTRSIPRVEKIVGPGNRYVTAAKRLVSQECGIDLPAGPTEVLVLARRGQPRFIAADLLAQAEHDLEATALFVTPSRKLAERVAREVNRQLPLLPRGNPARHALVRRGMVLLASSWDHALDFANRYAPEHLSLPEAAPGALARLRAAGSVFLGPWSAQPAGDYATGSNHVLPTGGWARLRGGLSTADFMRTVSVQRVSRPGLKKLAPVVDLLARAENLPAHARAVEVRR